MENEVEAGVEVLSPEVIQEIKRYASSGAYRTADKRAVLIMLELVNSGHSLFLMLRDDDIGQWWGKVVSTCERNMNNRKRLVKEYKAKMDVYNRLTAEERKALKIRKPSLSKNIDLEIDNA